MVYICNKSLNFAVILTKSRIEAFYCFTEYDAKLQLLLDITKYLPTKFFHITMKRKISLSELYQEKLKQKKVSPARQLIQDLMDATGRSEVTVRMWISGKFKPEPIIQNIIAEKLGVDVESLFPKTEA